MSDTDTDPRTMSFLAALIDFHKPNVLVEAGTYQGAFSRLVDAVRPFHRDGRNAA